MQITSCKSDLDQEKQKFVPSLDVGDILPVTTLVVVGVVKPLLTGVQDSAA